MIKVICCWCQEETDFDETPGKDGEYGGRVCKKCARTIPSSKKEYTNNVVGRKHIHRAFRNGERI